MSIKRSVKKSLLILAVFFTTGVLISCGQPVVTSERTYQGAGAGAAIGSVAGLLLDSKNRWRGALIGGLLGAAIGGTTTEIAARAAREAAAEGRPVAYKSTDGFQRVQATPVSYNSRTGCEKVRTRVWQEGKLVKDEIKEVC